MTYEAELRRRKFMQAWGRCLGWGFAGDEPATPGSAGVSFTSDGWTRPYERFCIHERYIDHGGDPEATERAVIDRAIAAYNAICEVR